MVRKTEVAGAYRLTMNLQLVILLVALALTLLGCGGGGGGQTTTTLISTTTVTIPGNTTTNTTTTITTTSTTIHHPGNNCLCVFDVDRTLTGKQSETAQCPKNKVQPGIQDAAYGGGDLTLSELGQAVEQTECNKCYVGVVSAGGASGPGSKERGVLYDHLSAGGKLPADRTSAWSQHPTVESPLVLIWPDGLKQQAVPMILAWYAKKGVYVDDKDVYFFDDRESNVQPFANDHPYNARQVSCATRDLSGSVGLCGSTLAEVVLEKGVKVCTQDGDDLVV